MGAMFVLIFGVLINVAILLVFLRFLVQLAMVTPYNPVVLSTMKATKVVDMFGRILPTLGKGRVNLAALVLLVVLCLLKTLIDMYVDGHPATSGLHLLIATFMMMTQAVVTVCRYLIFGSIISNLIMMLTQTRSPYIEVVQELAEPLLAPFRRLLPNMGMIDLSPMVAIFTLYIVEIIMDQVNIALLTGF